MDSETKKKMQQVCKELGMSMSTAFNIFATKVSTERRIPFELTLDPFYSEANMRHLEKSIDDLNRGKGVKHDLIEA
jgi:DNA-damage-inducible protein J